MMTLLYSSNGHTNCHPASQQGKFQAAMLKVQVVCTCRKEYRSTSLCMGDQLMMWL